MTSDGASSELEDAGSGVGRGDKAQAGPGTVLMDAAERGANSGEGEASTAEMQGRARVGRTTACSGRRCAPPLMLSVEPRGPQPTTSRLAEGSVGVQFSSVPEMSALVSKGAATSGPAPLNAAQKSQNSQP